MSEPSRLRRVAVAALLASGTLPSARPAAALDPGKAVTQYVHDVWQGEQGLPQSSVTTCLQTRDGYLWLGTEEGLVRFDGVRFTVFDRKSTPQMRDNFVLSLGEDRSGGLYVGTSRGLLYRKGGVFRELTRKDGQTIDGIRAVVEDRAGNVWVGTQSGVLRLRGDERTPFTAKDGLRDERVRTLLAGRDGGLWIGTAGGLHHLKDGRMTALGSKEGLAGDRIVSLAEARDGSLWIGTDGGGLQRLGAGPDGRLGPPLTTKDGLPHDSVFALLEDRDGNLWVGTLGGVARLRDRRIATFTARNGLTVDSISSLLEDREGSVWIGTDGGGLNRLRDGKVTPLSMKEGLSHDEVATVLEGRDGSLWVGGRGGLDRVTPAGVVSLTSKDGLASDRVLSLLEGRDGTLWAGTRGGLTRWSAGRPVTLTSADGLAHDRVNVLLEDRDGSVWIGTRGGLDRWREGRIAHEGPSNVEVLALLQDRSGAVWAGTRGGLSRWKDGTLTTWTRKDGLGSDRVTALHEDGSGTLWLGTLGGGLVRFAGRRFVAITTREGLADDNVFRILEDDRGTFWMSSNKGIFRIARADLDAFAEGRASGVTCGVLGRADGMRSQECNGATQPAGWKAHDGRLWFPTIRGVVAIDPARLPVNPVPPPVVVEEVRADGRTSPVTTAPPVLGPGVGKLEIRYTALSLVTPARVRFQVRLDGFDADWADAGSERTAHYTNLAPGTYVFRVRACNDDGLWNETGASLGLTLLPRFFQTWWFRGLEGLAVLGLLAAAFGVQRRRHEARRIDALRSADLARKTEELESARRVQLALLPREPLTLGEWSVAGGMETATEVGGDYFGYFEVGKRLCVVIGDATGHGMASGLVAGMLKASLASLAERADPSAGATAWLADLNSALRTSISQRGLGVCLGIAFVDVATGEVEVGLAGVPHPFLVTRDGAVERLVLSGTPLGYMKKVLTSAATRVLGPGDRLVLLTDGLVEQTDAAGEEWGYAGVETALGRLADGGPATARSLAEGLLAACAAHAGGPPLDDRTVVVLARG